MPTHGRVWQCIDDHCICRLGLGASASAYHVRQAEERKLKNQLLSHAKKHGKQDEESRLFAPKVSPSKRAALDDATDSDDEESRAGSIKKKKAPAPDNGATSSEASTSTPKKAASLFNPPTPAAASPSPAKTGLKPVVGASFYGNASSNGASALAGLSKNQRKKERERLRKLETQRAKEDESRREAEAEAKRLLADVGDDQEVDIEDSVDLAVPVSGLDEPSKAEGDDDDDAVGEQASPAGADSAGKASTGVASPGKSANGTAEEGKKKKKRRRKSKAAAQQESPRLLNL